MQRYKNAKIGKRFLAHIIDYGIFSIIAFIIYNSFIAKAFSTTISEISRIQTEAAQNTTINLNDTILQYQNVEGYTTFASVVNLFILGFIVVLLLYFVLLPKFWDKQTVGRAALNIKLVSKFDEEVTYSNLLMRQIVGRFIFVFASMCCFIGLIIEFVLMLRKNPITIEDLVGGTKMVDLSLIKKEVNTINNPNSSSNETVSEFDDDADVDSDVFDFMNKK